MEEEKIFVNEYEKIDQGDFSYITTLVANNDLATFTALMNYIYRKLNRNIFAYTDLIYEIREHFFHLLPHELIASIHDLPDFIFAMENYSYSDYLNELDDASKESLELQREEFFDLIDLYIDDYQHIVRDVVRDGYGELDDLPPSARHVLYQYLPEFRSDQIDVPPSNIAIDQFISGDYTSLYAFSTNIDAFKQLLSDMQTELNDDEFKLLLLGIADNIVFFQSEHPFVAADLKQLVQCVTAILVNWNDDEVNSRLRRLSQL